MLLQSIRFQPNNELTTTKKKTTMISYPLSPSSSPHPRIRTNNPTTHKQRNNNTVLQSIHPVQSNLPTTMMSEGTRRGLGFDGFESIDFGSIAS